VTPSFYSFYPLPKESDMSTTPITAPVPVAVPPVVAAPVPISKPVAAVAGTGVIAGLLTVFLPLLQATPGHLSTGEVATAIGAGASIIIGSVLGWLAHHGVISKAQITSGTAAITAYLPTLEKVAAQMPLTQKVIDDGTQFVRLGEAKLVAWEDRVSTALTGSTAAVAPVEADLENAALKALSGLLGGHEIVTTTGVVAIPAAAPASGVTVTPAPLVVPAGPGAP
jgi:hypothetical protein